MKRALNIWVIAGDLRCHWLARQLAEDGMHVHSFGQNEVFLKGSSITIHDSLSQCATADVIILPLPMVDVNGNLSAPFAQTPLPLEEVFAYLSPQQRIFAGQVKEPAKKLADSMGLNLYDYFTREELAIANAVPTAEGCLQIAMERLPITVQDGNFLVTGYGKVATATAKRLAALGASVTVAARNSLQREQAKAEGFHTDHIYQLLGSLSQYDCIINTVPALIFQKELLEDMNQNCLLIDLASLPGGIDFAEAERLQRTAISALSLPGKVAPASAGSALKRTLYFILGEESPSP